MSHSLSLNLNVKKMNATRKYWNFISNMGLRYLIFRIFFTLKQKTGILKKEHPYPSQQKKFISVDAWRSLEKKFIIDSKETFSIEKLKSDTLKADAEKILVGEICFFNNQWINLGLNYNWKTNPITNYNYHDKVHWSNVEDFSFEKGDIKYVWEKSRFTFLLTLIRYDYHFNEDNSEFVFEQIENWIDHNPINQGPNWKCSQEISLRIINWTFALHFYQNSDSLTEKRWEKIQHVIYWSLHHVYKNINFSRIAVRNNHAITETMFLALSEILYPFIPETKSWSKKGRNWFEKEIEYQIYDDGTYLQFSMNYQRVLTQLLSFAISLTELNNTMFSDKVYSKAYKSVNFLYQCLIEENGYLPNYGANDGALFFALSNTEYRDYRPQINTLHHLLTGFELYDDRKIREDSSWFSSKLELIQKKHKPLQKQHGSVEFPIGGYYILREDQTFTFIRCGNHKDRPSHADNLHIDIWKNGVNILRDSGTYKYNTEREFQDYFTGTKAHNSVSVENCSQMFKGNRFIWFFWSQSLFANWKESDYEYIFTGQISAFTFLNKKAKHERSVIKLKGKDIWIIKDVVYNLNGLKKFQTWHFDKHAVTFESKVDNSSICDPITTRSYYSDYYGIKENGQAISFEFENNIETILRIKNNEN